MTPDLSSLPALPADDDGPVFAEPWQAQAFGLALVLYEAGFYTWREWADALAREIADAADRGDAYYLHWLNALERLCIEKTGLLPAELVARKERWRRAYLSTPHGRPVTLEAERREDP
ncbi:MAG: nitrile hydratase accessory protein [Proteobacteria bacterium]|nr:MAG: nitrile hydratase accessory protein [Pseudomonadota bacterium]